MHCFRILLFAPLISISIIWSAQSQGKELSIGVISLDGMEIGDTHLIKDALISYYNCEVVLLKSISGPEEIYWNKSDTLKPGEALRFLREELPYSMDLIMGVTEYPMFLGSPAHPFWKKNGFIRGLADSPGQEDAPGGHKT